MKKRFYLLGMLAAGLTFAGCTDDIDDATGNGGNTAVGDGYVKVAINLPTTSGNSTRADSENDNFDDGLAAEYKVKNVILALFYGANESTATCKWAADISTAFHNEGTTTDNITTKSEMVISEVPKHAENENVYAFAIINNSGYFTVDNTANTLKFDATGSTPSAFSGTLSDLFDSASTVDLSKIASTGSEGNFMMTNAPISDKASVQNSQTSGWDPTISTLVKVNVYDDEPTAEAAPSNPIYVERVAAKVEVKVNSDDNSLNVTDNEAFSDAKVTFTNWALQNTNKKTYLVRNVVGSGESAAWKTWITYFNTSVSKENRFVGEISGPYRTYWGIDPNYTTVAGDNLGDNFNVWTSTNDPNTAWLTPNNNSTTENPVYAYCAENTTQATSMLHNQLTGVLLKATFYLDKNNSTGNFFTCNNTSKIYTEENMIQAFTATLAEVDGEIKLGDGETLQIKTTATAGKKITDATGLKAVFEVKVSDSSSKDLTDDQANAILEQYNPINFYKDGVTFYYTSLIKHFGDTYTLATNINNAANDYNDNDHLGRYGVVRNNWYELNIKSVSGPGEPEIPEIPEEPADKEHSYINTEINILSWAKRTQNVDL